MIDIENKVYTEVKNALVAFDSNVETANVFQNTPSKFPFVSIEMIDNSKNYHSNDSDNEEKFSNQTFEVNIASKSSSRKTQAKALMQVVDEYFQLSGFNRIAYSPYQDNETYRIALRYEAVVSNDHTTYRR